MRTVQEHPLRRSPLAIVGASALIGVIIAIGAYKQFGLTAWAIGGGVTVVFAAGITLGLRLAYPPIRFDEVSSSLVIGLRTVPLSSVTGVLRRLVTGQSTALTLRLVLASGRQVRVLIASNAVVRDLDAAERVVLLDALQRSAVPRRLDEDAAATLTDLLATDRSMTAIGLDAVAPLLDDRWVPTAVDEADAVEAELAAADAGALASGPEATASVDPGAVAAAAAAFGDPAAVLDARTRGARRAGWFALALVPVLLIVGFGGAFASGERASEAAVAFVLGGTGGALLAYVAWTALVDAAVRAGRRVATEWMSDPNRASAGLPDVLRVPWLRSPRNLRATLAFIAQPIGGLLLIAAIVLTVAPQPGVPVWVTVAAYVLVAPAGWAGIGYLRYAQRAKRRDAEWLVGAIMRTP